MDPQSAVTLLNGALELDQLGISLLVHAHVECNEQLATHPTITTAWDEEDPDNTKYHLGVLGILNGLFLQDGKQVIYAEFSEEDPILIEKFGVRDKWW